MNGQLDKGLRSALNAAAQPSQEIEVSLLIEIALDTKGNIHSVIKHGGLSRPLLNMVITTAHQDLLTQLVQAERERAKGPAIAIAPPGSDVERNPKA